jgi:hypothetical protein
LPCGQYPAWCGTWESNPTLLGLEGPRTPPCHAYWRCRQDSHPRGRGLQPGTYLLSHDIEVVRNRGVEPHGDIVGNDISHHEIPRIGTLYENRTRLTGLKGHRISPEIQQCINWRSLRESHPSQPVDSGPAPLGASETICAA